MVARLECAPRAGPGERRRTNRWTGARIASFSTNFVRSHLLGVAAPGQLNRSAANHPAPKETQWRNAHNAATTLKMGAGTLGTALPLVAFMTQVLHLGFPAFAGLLLTLE